MSKVSKSVPLGDARVEASLKGLRAEYGGWAIQCLPVTELPWEAFRHPGRCPVSGGVGWLRAESAEWLGKMISAAERMEAQLDAGEGDRS